MSYSYVSSGQVTSGMTFGNGDYVFVLSGGVASNTSLDGGVLIVEAGSAAGTEVNSGSLFEVVGGPAPPGSLGRAGTATDTNVNYGGQEIVINGTDSGGTVASGGWLEITGYGTAYATNVSGGGVLIVDGSASGTVVDGGGVAIAAPDGTVTSASIASGGALVVMSGATVVGTGADAGALVVSTGVLVVSAGGDVAASSVGDATATAFGQEIFVLFGGTAGSVTITGGGFGVVSGGAVGTATVGSGSFLTVDSAGTVSASLLSGGLEYSYSGSALDAVTIEDGGIVDAEAGAVDNVAIDAGGILELGGGVALEDAVVNSGGLFAIEPTGSNLVTGSMRNLSLALGGAIVDEALTYAAGATASISGEDLLTVIVGGTSVTIQLVGDYSGDGLIVTSGGSDEGPPGTAGVDGTLVTLVPCYCRGTRILTDGGEVAVEELAIGDRVVTVDGTARAIRWIGRRAYDGRFIRGDRDVLPVLFKRGSLGEGVPVRDLWVSPLHAMFIDGMLIPAWVLVNGVSILQAEAVDKVEYFHVELDGHDVIFAEGAAAESFVDDNGRGMFQNATEYRGLYPDDGARPAVYCAPRLEAGAAVERVRAALLERAGGFEVPVAMLDAGRVESLLVPAGATTLRVGEPSAVIGVVLDGERLEPAELRWIGDSDCIAIEPVGRERWCHMELASRRGMAYQRTG